MGYMITRAMLDAGKKAAIGHDGDVLFASIFAAMVKASGTQVFKSTDGLVTALDACNLGPSSYGDGFWIHRRATDCPGTEAYRHRRGGREFKTLREIYGSHSHRRKGEPDIHPHCRAEQGAETSPRLHGRRSYDK